MKLMLLIVIVLYWIMSIAVFTTAGTPFTEANGWNITGDVDQFNTTAVDEDEIDTGGFFSTGVDFSRLLALSSFGVQTSPDMPDFINTLLTLWQVFILIITIVGLILSAVWDG